MKLSSIILKIAEKMDGQRSLNASLHVLRGKRSGQTLQDIDYFSVKPYFSLIPKLADSTFAEAVISLQHTGMIKESEGIVTVTEKGKRAAKELGDFQFDGWHYRGREEIFFLRLVLLVQTLSQLRSSRNSFHPITNDRKIQQFVKDVLHTQQVTRTNSARSLAEELLLALKMTGISDLQAILLSHRLTGADASGWTWEQLEESTGESVASLQLEYLEALHRLIAVSERVDAAEKLPILHKLATGIRIETPLTDSTAITKKLFDQELSIDEIAIVRQLKVNTIEDHITEIATNDADFPIDRFVDLADQLAVQQEVRRHRVKRLRLLKDKFPHLSYFQLRLILSTTKGEPV
ncbi:helix-turn-helix domain-containing protein [Sporosarcina gallistercoris]|uniref:Helix-turn-helix domain-containing protein n=1 Tax=Sporosarcina gallistercoris TaxID=2762245 RepID=A0ABR8PFN4_9BACL|nr:helix-turn-helix domain-containing protein [Sporosarcina gallistercoris]MBD7906979.1 helix-turn-helix domain-containing protein [Sporosarcina gallistercoris]